MTCSWKVAIIDEYIIYKPMPGTVLFVLGHEIVGMGIITVIPVHTYNMVHLIIIASSLFLPYTRTRIILLCLLVTGAGRDRSTDNINAY